MSPPTAPLLLFGSLYLFWMALLFRPALVSIDGTGYYSWVQSLVIHHNLDVDPLFLARACGGPDHPGCLFQRNPYGIGVALFLSPFFLLAHGLAPLLHAPQDGLSRPYIVLCSLGSSLWGLGGLLLSWRVAKSFLPRVGRDPGLPHPLAGFAAAVLHDPEQLPVALD